tara:strand:+ start:2289 stop:3578 length:1290 start_codon:yes stop_codon:yes gene_type:complete
MTFKTISVIGLGYIGLPTAAIFASRKIKVLGVDINQSIVDTINNGKIHIVEPELDIFVKNAVKEKYLRASTSVESADAFLIAVPTPFIPSQKDTDIPQPDLKYIEMASRSISQVLKKGDLVILESTSPVGTSEIMAGWLSEERPDLSFPQTHGNNADIKIAYCPERVLPGKVIYELIANDRLIGGMSKSCSNAAAKLYEIFVEGSCIITNARTAEMAKLTENASRDVNIAFANELSILCDQMDVDVWELIALANRHPRVNILQPGPGVGGHCIAVDPWFIVSQFPKDARLIKEARYINDNKPKWVLNKVNSVIENILVKKPLISPDDLIIACYGLAFKSNIDDLRESPALLIAKKIIDMHPGEVLLVEPHITKLPINLSEGRLSDFDHASKKADIHLLLVDHDLFKNNKPSSGEIIDTRGIWHSGNIDK